jgi:uncharacterized membrane protein YeaQ/YmgE (transglycosylase-associated protein family)
MNTVLWILVALVFGAICFIYGKAKTKKNRTMFTLILFSTAANVAHFFLFVIGSWKFLELGNFFKPNYTSDYQIFFLLWPFLLEYALISLLVICVAAWKKGGFENLKGKKGLITYLINGLAGGFIGGLILKLFFELYAGPIFGFVLGLIGGLIIGVVIGFQNEFEPEEKNKKK